MFTRPVRITLAAVAAVAAIGAGTGIGATVLGSHASPAAASAPASPAPASPAPARTAPAPVVTVTPPAQKIIVAPPAPQVAVPPAPAPAAPSGYTYAGDGVWAGPNTSAAFALSVHQAWLDAGEPASVTAYSPVTGQVYVMTQTGSAPYVFIGGNSASVEFWS